MPNKADLILHPARLKILMALAQSTMTTQELAARLDDLPKSSIYRHIRALVEGGMLTVAETRLVKGTPEKVYQLAQAPHLTQADLSGLSAEDHLRYFATYLASHLEGFRRYLAANPQPDFDADRVGYTEVVLQVTPDELERVLTGLNQAVLESAANPPGEDRRPHKIAVITYPVL